MDLLSQPFYIPCVNIYRVTKLFGGIAKLFGGLVWWTIQTFWWTGLVDQIGGLNRGYN